MYSGGVQASTSNSKPYNNIPMDDEDGDPEAEEAEREMEAWERAYADERSWEALQEDESGLLRAVDVTAQQREKRQRFMEAPVARIRRGMIRYLYLVVDMSRASAELDFKPNRLAVVANAVEDFVREFFDQNPLSHLGLITIRDGLAKRLTDLSSSPETHIKALRANMDASGDASVQNALELARGHLSQIPNYGHREVLVIFSALSTCDPGDVFETLKLCKQAHIRVSIVGLSAEIYICRQICDKTGGSYGCALNEHHLRELIFHHAPPPPALAESAAASLVRMGFPQRGAGEAIALCNCHREVQEGGGYACPRCKGRVCELPTECHLCGLTLVSSPHLARSYHHLFPIPIFDEITEKGPENCFACRQILPFPGGAIKGVRLKCPRCSQHFCFDCDAYIHESLHNCPGCECLPTARAKK